MLLERSFLESLTLINFRQTGSTRCHPCCRLFLHHSALAQALEIDQLLFCLSGGEVARERRVLVIVEVGARAWLSTSGADPTTLNAGLKNISGSAVGTKSHLFGLVGTTKK